MSQLTLHAPPQINDPETERLSRRAWGTLLVLCGALFLDALDVSMIGVALPSIRTDLSLSTDSLQWIVSAYVLGYGGFLLLGGRAADLLGRRRMFLVSLAVFLVASGLGGVATGAGFLIATRFIKGVSAAFTAPAGFSIITTSFPEGRLRNRALAVYTATGATGFSLGLVIGGALTELGWRWVFFVPVAVSAVVLVAAVRLVPKVVEQHSRSRSFDAPGAVGMTPIRGCVAPTTSRRPPGRAVANKILPSVMGRGSWLIASAGLLDETNDQLPACTAAPLKKTSMSDPSP